MPNLPEIIRTHHSEWENRHLTFKQKIEGYYDMWNAREADAMRCYNLMTQAVMDFIAQAHRDNTPIRALGAGWSWTKIATTEGRMLNTRGLNLRFDLAEASVTPEYRGSREHLVFAQCGCAIQELNSYLRNTGRSLPTSGASNGQTIAGALSTGTHGSAFDVGAIPEYVVGLHLILSPTRHIWLERASHPVLSEAMVHEFKAELVRDDALFNAALVSFGCFGFIHGVLLETVPLFLLETYRVRPKIDEDLRHLMATLDFEKAQKLLPRGPERPFHFQVLINPYDLKNGAYSNVMYKHPFANDYTPPSTSINGYAPGDDAPSFLGTLRDGVPFLIPFFLRLLLRRVYQPYSNVWGTTGEIFTNTTTQGKVLSAAVGIPLECVNIVTDILLDVNRTEGPFSGLFAYRYVKSTSATLGFSRFKPVTCIVELDGMNSSRDRRFYKKVWAALDSEQIPYTFHWGKHCEITPERIRNMYGDDLDKWLDARRTLLEPDFRRLFDNGQMREWGLI